MARFKILQEDYKRTKRRLTSTREEIRFLKEKLEHELKGEAELEERLAEIITWIKELENA